MRNVKIQLSIFVTIILISCLSSEEVFEIEYDLNPYITPTTGDFILKIEARCLQVTPDGGYAILMEIDLTDGMLAHFCTALLKTDSDGAIEWFEMLTNDPTLDDFHIMMQGFSFARGFTVTNDEGYIIPITGNALAGGDNIGTFILKLDRDGQYEWHTQLSDINSTYRSYLNSVRQTSNSDIFVVGHRDYGYPIYYEAMEIVKMNTFGDTLWTNLYDSNTEVYDMEFDNEGNMILAAISGSSPYCYSIDIEGNVNWQTEIMDFCTHYAKISLSKMNLNNFYYIGFVELPDLIHIKQIDQNGEISITNYEYTLAESNRMFPISIVFDSTNLYFTGRIEGNYDVSSIDQSGIFNWQFEKKWYGDGIEVLQQTEDGNFAVISVLGDDLLVLTKFDENGSYTSTNNLSINDDKQNLANYPNPFNPETTISFELQQNIINPVIEIFNIKGEKIRHFSISNNKSTIYWDGTDKYHNQVSSGVYLYQLKSDDKVLISNKMLLLK